MRRRAAAAALAVLAALAAAPAGEAQGDDLFLGATLVLTTPADLRSMEALIPTRAGANSFVTCGDNHFTLLPGDGGFRFSEANTENGCGEARFQVRLPAQAGGFRIRFQADREAVQPATAEFPIQMIQDLRVYAANDTVVPFHEQAVFPKQSPSSETREPFSVDVPLPHGLRDLVVGFYFEDEGVNLGQAVPNPVFGQWFRATVTDIRFDAVGIPAEPDRVTRSRGSLSGDRVEERLEVALSVREADLEAHEVEVQIAASPRLVLDAVVGPGGQALGRDQVVSSIQEGVLQTTVLSEATGEHGPGRYQATFVLAEELKGDPFMYPVALVFVAAPAGAGLAAYRSARRLQHQAVGPLAPISQTQGTILAGLALVYATVVVGVLALGQLDLLAAWPLYWEAGALYVVLVALFAGFLSTSHVWRRRLTASLEAEAVERERSHQELERSNKELEQFAYVASHDLQEPLRMVASYTDLLSRRYAGKLDKEADEFIGYAVDGAQRMQRLIDDLLTFSRVGTAGKPFRPTKMAGVVDAALQNLKVAIAESRALVETRRMPTVNGDETQLVQLVQNLIGNAVKFRGKRRPRIQVACRDAGERWEFSVRDNGIGIDPKYFDRIFVIFQRLHGRDEYEGTGIGLAVCKRIVERHGGRIWVESAPGAGATFFFTLPKPPVSPK